MTDSTKSIALICDRLGPYHVARLNELGRLARVTAIEMSKEDTTYKWEHAESGTDFRRLTLFSDKPWNLYPVGEVIGRVKAALTEIGPDLVAIPGWESPAALSALQWCLKSATPSVLMADSQYHDFERVWWKEALKSRLVPLHNAGFVGGHTHVEYLVGLGMSSDRITLGYNVVDNDHFTRGARAARETAASVRKELNLPERYFMTTCRFVEKKNLVRLLHAYAACFQALGASTWELVIVGDGPLRPHLLELTRELGIQDKVIYAGFKQYHELPAYYALASAFVLPSTGEQWGLVVNEAMACGLPVLVSEVCGCAKSLVKDGSNGFAFHPHDEAALGKLLQQLNSGGCDLESMGRASREFIAAYTPKTFAGNLMSAAEQAAGLPRKRPTALDRAIIHLLANR